MAKFDIGQWSKDEAVRRAARNAEYDLIDEMTIELFGHAIDEDPEKEPVLSLRETCIVAQPDVLRAIAKFINEAADDMEHYGERFNHAHWRSRARLIEIVVGRPETEEEKADRLWLKEKLEKEAQK